MPRERADADPAEPARQEPSGREDQQQGRDAEGQERPEPVEEPQGQVGAEVGLVRPDREADVGLGQAVQRPDRGDREQRPAEALPRVVREHDERAERRWPDRPRRRRRRNPGRARCPARPRARRRPARARRRPGPRSRRPAPRRRARLCRARRRPGIVDAGPPGRVDRAHRWSYRTSVAGSGARGTVRAVADQEPDRGDDQPQRGDRTGHVLQRRDPEQQGEAAHAPARRDRSSAARRRAG